MVKSWKEGGIITRRSCRIGRHVLFCTATTCGLLLVAIFQHWTASDAVVAVRVSVSGVPGCLRCNPDMVKFLQGVRKEKRLRAGRNDRADEVSVSSLFPDDEKFMYYAPHSGFSNQVMELKNALVFAKLLNRTLIIPPVLDHHAAWLGSCPKRRVLPPHRLRALVWTRISELIMSSRYISMADIIDLSAVTPSQVKTIDLRIFLALWCGVDIKKSCGGAICKTFAEKISIWGAYKTCVELLNPLPEEEQKCCVHSIEDDCTSTIWRNTMKPHNARNMGNVKSHDDSLEVKRLHDVGGIIGTVVNRSHDVMHRHPLNYLVEDTTSEWNLEKKTGGRKRVLDIMNSLGSTSSAGNVPILAFGSLFSSIYKGSQTYIDFESRSGDEDMEHFFRALKRFSFNSEIIGVAQKYVREGIAKPFYCVQLRLLDGQFKSHKERTFNDVKVQLYSYHQARRSRDPMPIFVMTDLPSKNWSGSVLNELKNSHTLYHVQKLDSNEEILRIASAGTMRGEFGFRVGYGSHLGVQTQQPPTESSIIPYVILAVEEAVCSCASLGFTGTVGSTIADSIRDLRATNVCTDLVPLLVPA